jgi:uridylate kinase
MKSTPDVILKGTRVDGIYDSDPEKNPNAVRYDKISFAKVISMGLVRHGYDSIHIVSGKQSTYHRI